MEKTLVVGGSGFIGSAMQRQVINQRKEDAFAFSYSKHPEKISDRLEKVRLNLLKKNTAKDSKNYQAAIYVAGNANHGLARSSPLLDLNLNVKAFLNFLEGFRGSLVLLSSQAVYYGLEGEIPENVDHVSTVPYGISKQMTEAYAKYFLRTGTLSKLWIFRLMYAFGESERARRLIPRCAKAVNNHQRVIIYGGGKSFLNPLPSWFVAKVLTQSSQRFKERDRNFIEITNLNYPQKTTVQEVVRFLESIKHFDYTLTVSGEEWPVRFWGNVKNLTAHMREWKMTFPDLWDNLKKYFVELVEGKENG